MQQPEETVVPISSAPSYPARRRPTAAVGELARLLRSAAAGDERAWEAMIERFSGCIRAIVRSHRLSAHDVDDVVQTTWLRLLERADTIREPERLGTWLQTTARRESLRILQAAGREQPTEAEVFERHAARDETDRRLEAAERRVALDDAIEKLPVRHRKLIRMLLVEPEPSYSDVSATLDMPIGSIGPIRARCLTRLRRNPRLMSAA